MYHSAQTQTPIASSSSYPINIKPYHQRQTPIKVNEIEAWQVMHRGTQDNNSGNLIQVGYWCVTQACSPATLFNDWQAWLNSTLLFQSQ
jgi:hypothetical protein